MSEAHDPAPGRPGAGNSKIRVAVLPGVGVEDDCSYTVNRRL